jgi:tetraacyldisaccharide 4'-kinase
MISPFWSRLLFLPGFLMEGLIRVRNGLYAAGWVPQHRLPHPVISVGNLTLGGTGKTPLVICVARFLRSLGVDPVLLSRGYGRTHIHESHLVPPGDEIGSMARILGDEPALIRKHVPEIWLGISRDRYDMGCRILRRRANPAFVLDDGFQHRQLHRDLDIVIIDSTQPLVGNRVFPQGTLREPLEGLRRAGLILINSRSPDGATEQVEKAVREMHPSARVLHCRQEIEYITGYDVWKSRAEEKRPSRPFRAAFLVAALANPERFRRDVSSLGIPVQGARFYRDHYCLKPRDWISCVREARTCGADAIMISEKDAIKLSQPPDFPLMVAVQSTRIAESTEFENILRLATRSPR